MIFWQRIPPITGSKKSKCGSPAINGLLTQSGASLELFGNLKFPQAKHGLANFRLKT
jgi:hypothetical protein